VFVQIGLESKRFMTLDTFKILVRRVRLHVRPQIRAIGERLATMSASVRLLAGVAAQVAL